MIIWFIIIYSVIIKSIAIFLFSTVIRILKVKAKKLDF